MNIIKKFRRFLKMPIRAFVKLMRFQPGSEMEELVAEYTTIVQLERLLVNTACVSGIKKHLETLERKNEIESIHGSALLEYLEPYRNQSAHVCVGPLDVDRWNAAYWLSSAASERNSTFKPKLGLGGELILVRK